MEHLAPELKATDLAVVVVAVAVDVVFPQLDHPDLLELREVMDKMELQDKLEILVPTDPHRHPLNTPSHALIVLQLRMDHQDPQDHPDLMETQELQDMMLMVVLEDPQDQPDQ